MSTLLTLFQFLFVKKKKHFILDLFGERLWLQCFTFGLSEKHEYAFDSTNKGRETFELYSETICHVKRVF